MHENIKKKAGHWESFDGTDGLAHYCRCLLEDSDGMLWIGTRRGGVCRYDGKRFVTFMEADGLAHNGVRCLYQNSEGALWIGTEQGGLSRYDGSSFISFTTADGLADNDVRCLAQDSQGMLWIGTKGGLGRYDGSSFISFTTADGLAHNGVRCLYQDSQGVLWIGTSGGLSRYDGSEFVSFTTADGLADNDVRCLIQDSEGALRIGTKEGGLSRYDGSEFVSFTTADGLADNDIRCVHQDSQEHFWIGTRRSGVSCYDAGQFVNFTAADGLSGDSISDILQDREGNIWFACDQRGMSRYNPTDISVVSDESVHQAITLDSDEKLWWTSGDILSHFDGEGTSHYPFEDIILEIVEDREGQLWIGTRTRGVFRYDSVRAVKGQMPQHFTVDDGLVNNRIWKILQDSDGLIWICTEDGITCYNGSEFTTFAMGESLAANFVSVIHQNRRGTLWFAGFRGGGIISYDGEHFHRYTTADGLVDDKVVCMTTDMEDNLWVGTHGGISCYDGTSFRNYTTTDGLSGSHVQRLFQDSRGQIWIGTLGGGVSRFDGRNFQVLTTADGLPSNYITGIIEDSGGSMIISTQKGICRYVPDRETPPLIYIAEIEAGKTHKAGEDIRIPNSVSSFSIKYRGISFKTKRLRYNYMLEGYDKDWQSTWDEKFIMRISQSGDIRSKSSPSTGIWSTLKNQRNCNSGLSRMREIKR